MTREEAEAILNATAQPLDATVYNKDDVLDAIINAVAAKQAELDDLNQAIDEAQGQA